MNQPMNSLEQAIVSKDFSKVPVEVLEHYHLAAYSHIHDPASRTAKTKEIFLQFHMRHQIIKKQLISLFRAWHEAGIDVMVYKGFYLAEYIYTQPAERFYGDIDVIIKTENTHQAYEIAKKLGWQANHVYQAHHTHQAFYAEINQGQVRCEVHHQTIPMHYPLKMQWRQSFNQAIWQDAQPVDFAGTTVYIPQPVDAILLLIMDRYYNDKSREFLCHKVHDFLDITALIMQDNIKQEDVLARARFLDCIATVRWFLRRCSPWHKHLNLYSTRWQRWQIAWELSLFHGRQAALERFIANGIVIFLAIRESPSILKSLYQLQRHQELEVLFQKNTSVNVLDDNRQKNQHDLAEVDYGMIYGIKWATILSRLLIRLQGSGLCLVRSLTLYRRLLAKGYDVRFISGVRRDETGTLKGHAWVEYQGQPLPMLGDERSPFMFKESWCYPPRNESFPQNIDEAA